MELDNLTRFPTAFLPVFSRDGLPMHVVCVAARHAFPALDGESRVAEEQLDPIVEDRYWGEPGVSSLWMEGQGGLDRPGADVYVSGHAWAPDGRPVTALGVELRVGELRHELVVFGDRVWEMGIAGPRASDALPFDSMPLCYERAFGGPTVRHNPVGCGLYSSLADAVGRPLPNLEDRAALITSIRDRPRPIGVGPIARHWGGRVELGGTYDAVWLETRSPFWPEDLDPRFFNAASPGLTMSTRIRGGEAVVLTGLSVTGRVAFHLPRHRILLKNYFAGYKTRMLLDADALHVDTDARAFTLYYRALIAHGEGNDRYIASVVRELYPWEDPEP